MSYIKKTLREIDPSDSRQGFNAELDEIFEGG